MEIDKGQIIEELELSKTSSGFYTSDKITCPNCGKQNGKLGIKFIDNGGLTNCWSCSVSTSIFKFLNQIGYSHLIHKTHGHKYEEKSDIEFDGFMFNDNYDSENLVVAIPETIKLPKQFKRIYENDYLDSRGITKQQIEKFKVGTVDSVLYKNLKGKLIFQIFHNKNLVGLLGRSTKSKEWHDNNLKESKKGNVRFESRFWNSTGVEFQDILGGYDDITETTDLVIVVEGLTDKLNIDNLTEGLENTATVFTFGHSFSSNQRLLLKQTNVRTVILLYDPDSINVMKQVSVQLMSDFDKVFVAPILSEDDAGKINKNQLNEIFSRLMSPVEYFSSIVDIKI